jgi:hypothetical protein
MATLGEETLSSPQPDGAPFPTALSGDESLSLVERFATFSGQVAHLTELELPCGRQLVVTTQWLSGARPVTVAQSHPLRIFCAPPSGGEVRIGEALPGSSVTCTIQGEQQLARWYGFGENESQPLHFRYSVASSTSAAGEWREVGSVHWVRINISSNLQVAPAVQYLNVQACRSDWTCGPVTSSNPLLVVTDAPEEGVVSFQTLRGFLNSSTAVAGTWTAFVDATEGPAVGRAPAVLMCLLHLTCLLYSLYLL